MSLAAGADGRARHGYWIVIYCWAVTWAPTIHNKMDYVMKIFIEYDSASGVKTYGRLGGAEGKKGWGSKIYTLPETLLWGVCS